MQQQKLQQEFLLIFVTSTTFPVYASYSYKLGDKDKGYKYQHTHIHTHSYRHIQQHLAIWTHLTFLAVLMYQSENIGRASIYVSV